MKSVLAAITTHKRKPEMVERALKSVVAQTYTDWDLVVVDDSPADYEFRDDVRRMVEEWSRKDSRIRYVAHDKNYGAQRARNTALKIASDEGYEFIAYLDDDDEWLPEKLDRQLQRFKECNNNTGLIYCNGFFCNEKYKTRYDPLILEGNIYSKMFLFRRSAIGTFTSPLIRTEYLQKIGGMDERLPGKQDYDTWLRLTEHYEIAYVNEILYLKHNEMHGDQISKDPYKYIEALGQIFRKHESYLNQHKDLCRAFLKKYMNTCMRAGEYKKCLSLWYKLVLMQPMKIFSSIWLIIDVMIVHRVIFLPLRSMLRRMNTNIFYKLRNIKRKIKGEI